jgi:hypothetical protein
MKRFLLPVLLAGMGSVAQSQTTWSDDAATVFYNNCTQCHNPNGIGPFSLMDYATAYDYRAAIKVAVEGNIMPPWPADSSYQRYFHERLLTQAERDIIINWVDEDGPSGDLGTAPPPPVYNGEQILPGIPDLTVTMPMYMSKALPGADDYSCFTIPSGLATDRKIKAIEVIAGNPAIVHHCLVFTVNGGSYATDSTSHSCQGPVTGGLIGAYTPGASPTIFVETSTFSSGVSIDAGSDIVLAMHYPAGSYGLFDQTKVNIYFYDEPVDNFREVYAAPIIENWAFTIAANTIDTVYGEYGPIGGDITLVSVFPHMHLLGKYIDSYGITPLNDTLPFVRINNWDFHWQEFYFFKNMIHVPANTTMYGTGIYDNTTANMHNPNDPPIDVSAGLNTSDEMFLVYYHFMLYQAGDELINVDSLNTIFLQNPETGMQQYALNAWPNPFSSEVNISYMLDQSAFVSLYIYDVNGRAVRKLVRENQSAGEHQLVWDGTTEEGEKASPGIYFYSVMVDGVPVNGKLILNR